MDPLIEQARGPSKSHGAITLPAATEAVRAGWATLEEDTVADLIANGARHLRSDPSPIDGLSEDLAERVRRPSGYVRYGRSTADPNVGPVMLEYVDYMDPSRSRRLEVTHEDLVALAGAGLAEEASKRASAAERARLATLREAYRDGRLGAADIEEVDRESVIGADDVGPWATAGCAVGMLALLLGSVAVVAYALLTANVLLLIILALTALVVGFVALAVYGLAQQ